MDYLILSSSFPALTEEELLHVKEYSDAIDSAIESCSLSWMHEEGVECEQCPRVLQW